MTDALARRIMDLSDELDLHEADAAAITAASSRPERVAADAYFFPPDVRALPVSRAKRLWLHERHLSLVAVEELLRARFDRGLPEDKATLLLQMTHQHMVRGAVARPAGRDGGNT
jgi:hypothetical protein